MGRRQIFTPIAEDLKQRIAAGEFALGQPLPPERDLAEHYAVSRLTLRKALALLQDEGLLIRERGRGTTVAGGIATGAAGGTRPSLLYVGHTEEHVYKDLYLAVARHARAVGARIELVEQEELDHDGEQAPWRRLLHEAHGVIVQSTCLDAVLPHLPPERAALHTVGILDHAPVTDRVVVAVRSDRQRAAQVATRELLAAGHRRIAVLARGASGSDGAPRGSNEVVDGCRLEMAAAGRADGLQYLTVGWDIGGDDEAYERALLAAFKALGRTRPTAVVSDMDYHAASVYHVAEELKLSVPDQLSVVGIGDTPWCAALRPTLSSVSYDEEAMARAVLGLALLPTPTESLTLRIEPRFVARNSVAQR